MPAGEVLASQRRAAFLRSLPFEADRFQLEAFDALDAGHSVVVAAPTGSGKTVVAEYGIARVLADGAKAFYTTPLKALSNQKFGDFGRLYGPSRVGLLTGDNNLNPDAHVVVMTTEVLRNMIYADSPALKRLRLVVLDEIHYLQDTYRGPVWEEVIVHAPPAVQLVCLSATVSNAEELADWIATVRGATDAIIEDHRPVALQNFTLLGDRKTRGLRLLPTLVGRKANPEILTLERRKPEQSTPGRTQPAPGWAGRRGGARAGAPAGGVGTRAGAGVGARDRPAARGRLFVPGRTGTLALLARQDLLPAIVFVFSRAGCDDAVRECLDTGLQFTKTEERRAIREVAEARTALLSAADRRALRYGSWLSGLEAGIAAHHAGLVPPFKEAVEACFAAGLVRVVFATETLSLGINMPARSVVIESLSKFGSNGHRFLTPGEYTQLTGRAGRRGIDEVGSAIVDWSPFVPFAQVASLVGARAEALRSSFRPTYNMAANLVRRCSPELARELLGRSFAQYQASRDAARAAAPAIGKARAGGKSRAERGDQSLVRTFDRVLEVLERWGYVDGWTLTPAGERLARLYHESDLLVARCLDEGLFDDLTAGELVSLTSAFTYEARQPENRPARWPTSRVAHRWSRLERLATQVITAERRAGLPGSRPPDGGFAMAASAWCEGAELALVLRQGQLSGGDFVRNIKQLVDLLRQLGEILPDPAAAATARRATDRLFRGVVAVSTSLDTTVED